MRIHLYSLLYWSLILVILFGMGSCTPLRTVSSLRTEADSTVRSYLTAEQLVVGDFLRRRIFHLDMLAETMQPDAPPYPELDDHFSALKNYADSLTLIRTALKQISDDFTQQTKRTKRISEKSAAWKTFQQLRQIDLLSKENRIHFLSSYQVESGKYDSLITKFKVSRMTNPQLVEFIGLKLVQFQDSMEVEGRLLAQCKNLLNSQGWEKRSDEYKSRYRVVSEMELKLKQYGGLVGQLENALNRFEAGNMDEFFYKGPYMPERPSISATEDSVGKLIIEMQAFREMEQNFRLSFAHP